MSAPGIRFHSFGIHGGIHHIRAQRRAGEMLAVTEKAGGTLKVGPAVPAGNRGTATLAEMGITKKQLSTLQALASMNGGHFDGAC